MSLRLRILLLIAAVNVGLLLLLLAVGRFAGPPGRVSAAALREAQQAAADPSFDVSNSRYVLYTVRLPRGEDKVILQAPDALLDRLERKGEE
ncbi:MAG: hypothetical protein ACE5JG_00515, partial [Planctomycetota bacterium]